jgi:hypothetical protein
MSSMKRKREAKLCGERKREAKLFLIILMY